MIPLLISGGVAAADSLVGSRWLVAALGARGRSQPVLQRNADNVVVPDHDRKAGTPTLGGLAILIAIVLGYLVSHARAGVVFSNQTLIALCGITALATIGLIDDVIKLSGRRNRGLFWKRKGVITLGVSILVGARQTYKITLGPEAADKTVIGQLTVANALERGFVTACNCDGPPPSTKSDLNYDGNIRPVESNRLIVDANSVGEICFFTTRTVDLVIDIYGYTNDIDVIPNRRFDTR